MPFTYSFDPNFKPTDDIVFTSVNSSGGGGALTRYVEQHSDITPAMPGRESLDDGYHVVYDGKRVLVYVVSVDVDENTNKLLSLNLNNALDAIADVLDGTSIWMPLMGTGAGGMSFMDSARITINALQSHGLDVDGKVRIALPDWATAKQQAQLGRYIRKLIPEVAVLPGNIEDKIQFFLEKFPIESLGKMSLSDYTQVGKKDTFTYLLEFGSAKVGSIGGGSSFKFGIFNRKDKTEKKSGNTYRYTRDYAWYTRYGKSQKLAFETVRNLIRRTANLAREGQIEKIVSIELDTRLKWKVAFLYQDFSAPCVLSLYKEEALRALSKLPSNQFNYALAHRTLVMQKPENKDIWTYSLELWKQWANVQVVDKNVAKPEQDAFVEEDEEIKKSVQHKEEAEKESEPLLENELIEITPFTNDDMDSKDLLNIQKEVEALASLIAYKETQPPLSVGIFGEWGSGKSFYMNLLQKEVSKLAEKGREKIKLPDEQADDGQESSRSSEVSQEADKSPLDDVELPDFPFFGHIVSVRFNAWHYVEGELWASLAQKIYQELYKYQKDESAHNEYWLNVIKHGETKARVWEAKIAHLQNELDDKEKEIKEKSKFLDGRFAAMEVCGVDGVLEIAQSHLKENLPESVNQVFESFKSTKQTLSDLHGVKEELSEFGFTKLFMESHNKFKNLSNPVFWLFGMVFLLFGAAAYMNDWAKTILLVDSSPMWAAIYTFGLGITSFISAHGSKAVVWWNRIRKIKGEISDKVKSKIDEAGVSLDFFEDANKKLLALNKAKQNIENDVNRAKVELGFATPESIVKHHIEETAQADKYDKFLGLPTLLNADFETLSDAIKQQNNFLEWMTYEMNKQPASDLQTEQLHQPLSPELIAEFQKLSEQDKLTRLRDAVRHPVNRIVLYIDDLDRCPAHVVIKVLEAIKLFLSHDLFVVILGVDPRWLFASLKEHYSDILRDKDLTTGNTYMSTPEEYLEKIFQIPIWLQRPDAEGVARMLREYTGTVLSNEPPQDETVNGENATNQEQRTKTTEASGSDRTSGNSENRDKTKTGKQKVENGKKSEEKESEDKENDENYQVLKRASLNDLKVPEVEFMSQLAPILGRSPRSLKRYVNLYRIIKSSLNEEQQDKLLVREGYKPVCFLLAIVIGWPNLSEFIFHVLSKAPDLTAENKAPVSLVDTREKASIEQLLALLSDTLENYLEQTYNSKIKDNEKAQTLRDLKNRFAIFEGHVKTMEPEEALHEPMDPVKEWLNVVSRFSYSKLLDRNRTWVP